MSAVSNNAVIEMDQANKNTDILDQVGTMKMAELRDELVKRKVKTSGNKRDLRNRLRAAMFLKNERREDEYKEEEDEIEDDDDRDENLHMRVSATDRRDLLLTFRDVEESISVFSGQDKMNIHNWLQEFEEIAELCNWSDVQKII